MRRHCIASVPACMGLAAPIGRFAALGLLAAVAIAEVGLGGDPALPGRPVRANVTPDGGQADRGGHYP
ncbi:MAG: hypothetical protein ACYS9X_29890, partial [Planctomycetota bacterium]